jgi:hypothetical protein
MNRWYRVTVEWASGNTGQSGFYDDPKMADAYMGAIEEMAEAGRAPRYRRLLVTTYHQEPAELRADREAWETYRKG